MSGDIIENRGYVTPIEDVKQSFAYVFGAELRQLVDFRHPGPTLGRWAALATVVAGTVELSQIAQH